MGAKEAAQQVLRVLLGQDAHHDPYLELLRLGAASEHIESEVVVTLIVPGGLVTGTIVPAAAWEEKFLRGLDDYDLRRAVGAARDRIEENRDNGRRLPPDARFLHLRDVTYRDGRASHTLPLWRGPVAAVSGWTLGEPEKS
ncbi:hypothetical protein [Kitasatospora purpeofusca]|uniref:hypothetical protein n=1 Tax=Kitasatospora purpeofusca TaxID=67352 RepID=UPI00382556AC